MRRALRFFAVVAPVLACGALAACTADDDDEIFVAPPDADVDDASLGDATVVVPPDDATVQMDSTAPGDDDEASTRDAGRDASEGKDATTHDAEAGIGDGGLDAADAHDAEADADAGHDSGVDAAPPPPPTTYTLGGTITGLPFLDTVVLDNGAETVSTTQEIPIFTTSASFQFAKAIASGTMYNVTVGSSSGDLHCTVANGTGTITANVTNVAVTCVNAYWINPTTGVDSNAGTSAAPFKTLTHAIAAASGTGAYFTVEPGVYSAASGETFPIKPKSNQTFVGDVPNAGAGQTPTQIIGSGTSGLFTGDVVLSGVVNVSLSGLLFGAVAPAAGTGAGGTYGVIVDDSSATFTSNNLGSDGPVDLAIQDGSVVVLTSNTFTGNATALLTVADATSAVTARSNGFAGPMDIAIASTATLAKLDFGTAASLGDNTILPGGTAPAAGSVGLTVDATTGTLDVAGNIWTPNLEGAQATGRYATALVAGGPVAAGNENYAVATGANLQF